MTMQEAGPDLQDHVKSAKPNRRVFVADCPSILRRRPLIETQYEGFVKQHRVPPTHPEVATLFSPQRDQIFAKRRNYLG